jgi:biotin synthase-related radical SAM superfamily protein
MKICTHIEEENLHNHLNKPVYEYYKIKLTAFVVIKGVTDTLSQQFMSVQSQVHHFGNLCCLHYQKLMNLYSLQI